MGEEGNTWSPDHEDIFVRLLVQAVDRGGISHGSVGSKTWPEIYNVMLGLTDREWTLDQLQSKYNKLRTDHKEFSELLTDKTGFGWDPITNTVVGMEAQWQSYLRVNKKACRFRKEGCRNYEQLGIVFNRSKVTDVLREEEVLTHHIRSGERKSKGKGKQCVTDVSMGVSNRSLRRSKSMVDAERYIMFKEITEMAKARTEQLIIKTNQLKASSGVKSAGISDHPMARCVDLLNELAPEFPDEVYCKAMKELMSEQLQWAFIRMTPHCRRLWLSTLLP